MKKFISILIITFSLFFQSSASAQMDPKVKALGTMAIYGTVGGALLGAASMAFGTGGRSIAIGSSLGLYAGLLFGGYVVGSHAMKKKYKNQPQDNYYPETPGNSPYEEEDSGEGFFDSFGGSNKKVLPPSEINPFQFAKAKKTGPIYYVQLVNYQF